MYIQRIIQLGGEIALVTANVCAYALIALTCKVKVTQLKLLILYCLSVILSLCSARLC